MRWCGGGCEWSVGSDKQVDEVLPVLAHVGVAVVEFDAVVAVVDLDVEMPAALVLAVYVACRWTVALDRVAEPVDAAAE